ncbi:MAG: hypothetical protein HY073_03450 [Deltaproteobacteria bacterium]|nr:hypothetical protein [Deltaproteobacteria bacterium]
MRIDPPSALPPGMTLPEFYRAQQTVARIAQVLDRFEPGHPYRDLARTLLSGDPTQISRGMFLLTCHLRTADPSEGRAIALLRDRHHGPIPLSLILSVMYGRIPMLDEEVHELILSAWAGQLETTVEKLFSGAHETDSTLCTYRTSSHVHGSVALGGLVQVANTVFSYANYFGRDEMSLGSLSEGNSFCRFMSHPLLQLVFASYYTHPTLRRMLNGCAVSHEQDALALYREGWRWVLRRPPVEIAYDR